MSVRGQFRTLEFTINVATLLNQRRLNPHVVLDQAGDCGANTLFSLDVISREIAVDLSNVQNRCREDFVHGQEMGKEISRNYLYTKYLFTNIAKKYEIIDIHEDGLMDIFHHLTPGKATMLLMNYQNEQGIIETGHFLTVYKNEDGKIFFIDLQNEQIIGNIHEYFRRYNLFSLPTTNIKREFEGDDKDGKRGKFGGKRTKKSKKNQKKSKKYK